MNYSLTTMRRVALAEATTFLALLVATYVRHQHDNALGVHILGPIHGLLFLAYVFLALSIRTDAGWSNLTTGLILLGAVLPFGGYVVDRWLARAERPQST